MAGGTVEAGGTGAVIDVLAAVLARPAVDAHAVIATVGVVAGPAILAGVGHELTLVHVLGAVLTCGGKTVGLGAGSTPTAKPSTRLQPEPRLCCGTGARGPCSSATPHASPTLGPNPGRPTVQGPRQHADATSVWPLGWGPQTPAVGRGCPRARHPSWVDQPVGPGVHTCPLWRAAAVVGVHAVHAGASVLAVVSGTVVDVLLTVLASEACGGRSREPRQALPAGSGGMGLLQPLPGWTHSALLSLLPV